MKQISFAQAEYQNKKKVTRRDRFLAQLYALVPWQRLIDALSSSYFPNAHGKRGRPPIGLERMLRVYFLQQWYALANETLEDAIYESQAMQRDPEMKQAKKGNPWYFGMKTHIGVDAVTRLTHTFVATSANVADVTMTGNLVGTDDERVYYDAGYTGMGKYLGEKMDDPDSRCYVAAKRGAIQETEDSPMKTLLMATEKAKASIRGKVEHPFHIIKNLFGYRKVRYMELAKNQGQLFTLFALGNLVLARRCQGHADGASVS